MVGKVDFNASLLVYNQERVEITYVKGAVFYRTARCKSAIFIKYHVHDNGIRCYKRNIHFSVHTYSLSRIRHQPPTVVENNGRCFRLSFFKAVGGQFKDTIGCQVITRNTYNLIRFYIGKLKTETIMEGGTKSLDDKSSGNILYILLCIFCDVEIVINNQVIEIIIPFVRP